MATPCFHCPVTAFHFRAIFLSIIHCNCMVIAQSSCMLVYFLWGGGGGGGGGGRSNRGELDAVLVHQPPLDIVQCCNCIRITACTQGRVLLPLPSITVLAESATSADHRATVIHVLESSVVQWMKQVKVYTTCGSLWSIYWYHDALWCTRTCLVVASFPGLPHICSSVFVDNKYTDVEVAKDVFHHSSTSVCYCQ